jgi:hypothetical protein
MSMISRQKCMPCSNRLLLVLLAVSAPAWAGPSADLDQIRNGSAAQPVDPPDWVNGNAGSQNTHYLEAMSIPYRVRMTGLPTGTSISITLGYDTKRSGRYAIDYLTHYQRLEPHNLAFGHSAETVNPLLGVSGVSSTISGFVIPAPSSQNSPVAGQPTASCSALPEAERKMTLFGGTITSITYDTQGALSQSSAETRVRVTFTTDSTTAVLAWGGHIASRLDWGLDTNGSPLSAASISGSSYHTRLISWTLGSLGNQDRSLSADAVIVPPPRCTLDTTEAVICAGGPARVCVTVTDGMPPFTYAWTGPNGFTASTSCIEFDNPQAASTGAYSCVVTDSRKESSSGCEYVLTVNDHPTCEITGNEVVCEGTASEFYAPEGMITYAWTGPAGFVADTRQISVKEAGEYTVTITDPNGCQSTSSRTLKVNANPTCLITGTEAVCAGSTTEFRAPDGMAAYLWTGTDGFTASTQSITVGAAGEYQVTIVDANGCMNTCSRLLTVHKLPECAITGETVVCAGTTTEFHAPADMKTYAWTGPNGFASSDQSITVGAAGEYRLTIIDQNGCTSSCEKTLTVNPLPVCEIRNVPPALVAPTGMKSYSWTMPDKTTADTATITIPMSGWYELTIVDNNGCQSTCRHLIEGPSACAVTPDYAEVCAGGSVTFEVTATGGTAPFTYHWEGPDGFTADKRSIGVDKAGTYSVTVTDANNLSVSGCAGVLVVNPNPVPEIALAPEGLTCYASGNKLIATVSGGTSDFSYEWSVDCGEWKIDDGQGTDQISFSAGSGSASFSLKVTDSKGCQGIAYLDLRCEPRPPLGEFCSLTQGAYGNAGGKWNDLGRLDLIKQLLSYGPMLVGQSGLSVTFLSTVAQCIIDRLPAGGPVDTLPKALGDAVLGAWPGCQTPKPLPTFKNTGKFKNILLGQVITLSLNVRLDPGLGGFGLSDAFCTQAAKPGPDGLRGTSDDELDAGSDGVFGCNGGQNDDPLKKWTLPTSVLNALDTLSLSRTVNGLLDLANAALAGKPTGGASLSDINEAVSTINEAFDECRFLVECPGW